MNIVVRAPNWVGDCVLALPFVQRLRELHPSARLVVLARRPGAEVFEGNPNVSEVWTCGGFWETAGRLRGGEFDEGYVLPNSFSSALLFAVGGVRRRVGYAAEGRGFLLSESMPWMGEREHRALRYARLAEPALAAGALTPASHPARIAIDLKAIDDADHLLAGMKTDRLVAINPCANAPSRRWPAARYALLARMLVEQGGAEVVLVGGPAPDDRARVKEVLGGCDLPQVRDLGGRTTLKSLAAVLGRCKVVVSGDTGIMHVGAAAGAPLVALEGAADVAVTSPWTPSPFHAVDKHVPCSPCVKNHCINRETPMICMTSITPEEVFSAAKPFLG